MKAMILAAGFGKRMQPLTATCPKPLLQVAGKPLLEHHILNLKAAGFTELVVNTAYLSDQIVAFCDEGRPWNMHLSVSVEPEPLETAGGIIQALPLLGDAPFLVVNGDIWCPFPFGELLETAVPSGGAHLILTPNPPQHPEGDFSLLPDGRVVAAVAGSTATFAGVALYDPAFFKGLDCGKRPLKPLLDEAIVRGAVTGTLWRGDWEDVGTPDRLELLERRLDSQSG